MVPGWFGATALVGAALLAVVGTWLLRDGRARRRRRERLAAARRTAVEGAEAFVHGDGDGDGGADADDTDTDRSRSTPGDPVAVSGTVSPVVGTLQAPFSGASALVADWRVETDGPLRRRVGGGVDAVPFTVEDDTGRALVWPTPGAVTLEVSRTVAVGADERAPDPVRRFLSREDAPNPGTIARLLGGADRTYVESRVDPGDEVVVVGRPRPVPTDDRHRPDATAADGGRPALSVADADVAVAFGPPWEDDEAGADLGLTGPDPGPSLDAAPDAGLVVTDSPVEGLSEDYDDAARRVAAGFGLLVAALALAGAGGWAVLG